MTKLNMKNIQPICLDYLSKNIEEDTCRRRILDVVFDTMGNRDVAASVSGIANARNLRHAVNHVLEFESIGKIRLKVWCNDGSSIITLLIDCSNKRDEKKLRDHLKVSSHIVPVQ